MESISFLGRDTVGFRRWVSGSSRLEYQIGIYRRVARNTTFLIGTGGDGGSTPITVPTTGQIYPKSVNI